MQVYYMGSKSFLWQMICTEGDQSDGDVLSRLMLGFVAASSFDIVDDSLQVSNMTLTPIDLSQCWRTSFIIAIVWFSSNP